MDNVQIEARGNPYSGVIPSCDMAVGVPVAGIPCFPSVSSNPMYNSAPAIHTGGKQMPSLTPVPSARKTKENPLVLLKLYDTVFLVDNSKSMQENGVWAQTMEAIKQLAALAALYDCNGVDIHLLCTSDKELAARGIKHLNLMTEAEVSAIFTSIVPDGDYSPVGSRLETLMRAYISRIINEKEAGQLESKPVNYIVLTDGEFTDGPEEYLAEAARTLEKHNFHSTQVGVQFVQVGNNPAATECLRELDDDLSRMGNCRDMVDTICIGHCSGSLLEKLKKTFSYKDESPYEGILSPEWLQKILLGGINRREDKKKALGNALGWVTSTFN